MDGVIQYAIVAGRRLMK